SLKRPIRPSKIIAKISSSTLPGPIRRAPHNDQTSNRDLIPIMKTSSNRKLGLQFTERMTGYFLRDPNIDFDTLARTDPKAAEPFEFTLTIRSDDLDKMLTNPQHDAAISGTVTAFALSPQPMTVAQGVFNLFVGVPDETESRNMRFGF